MQGGTLFFYWRIKLTFYFLHSVFYMIAIFYTRRSCDKTVGTWAYIAAIGRDVLFISFLIDGS